jgi:hypothetical protein
MRRTQKGVAVALIAATVLVAGCYGPGFGYGAPGYGQPAVVVGPGGRTAIGPPAPGMVGPQPVAGISLGAGILIPSDEWVRAGILGSAGLALWVHPNVAIEIDGMVSRFVDESYSFGGELSVGIFTVNAIFSMPDPYAPYVHWRAGVGLGAMAVSHSMVDIDQPVSLFALQFGSDFLMQGLGRLFVVSDLLLGAEVYDTTDTYWWDFSGLVSLRFGLEFAF